MAQMNETFMQSVSSKALEIFLKTGLSQTEFCRRINITFSYLSALGNKKSWPKIPAWAWFYFQDIANGKIVFNSSGEIVNVSNGYTIDELIKDCKRKAEERAEKKKEDVDYEDELTVPEYADESASHDDMEVKKLGKYSGNKKLATKSDIDRLETSVMILIDVIIERNKEENKRLLNYKKQMLKWKEKKQ